MRRKLGPQNYQGDVIPDTQPACCKEASKTIADYDGARLEQTQQTAKAIIASSTLGHSEAFSRRSLTVVWLSVGEHPLTAAALPHNTSSPREPACPHREWNMTTDLQSSSGPGHTKDSIKSFKSFIHLHRRFILRIPRDQAESPLLRPPPR